MEKIAKEIIELIRKGDLREQDESNQVRAVEDVLIKYFDSSQPSEQKPHNESKFTLSAAIENLDKLASIGKSLLSEQKPSEGNLIQETDGKCKEILTKWLNTGFDLDIALPQAMQEYAQSERKNARNEAIQECIDIYKMNEWYDTILEKFEKLKSKTI